MDAPENFSTAYLQSPQSVFFFQAEDGIRDLTVTGVQTCALPISFGSNDLPDSACSRSRTSCIGRARLYWRSDAMASTKRSEEGRGGEECRCWGRPEH